MQNPFKPSAGANPPTLIGRDNVILEFENGIDEGVGAPGRLMRISGPRGSGKTVLLNDLGDRARDVGWNVVDVSAGVDLMDDLFYELSPLQQVASADVAASAGILSGTVHVENQAPSLRELMRNRAKGAGLAITIDEVQDASREDMQRIAHAVQHLIREGQNVALVFAGLTSGLSDLVNGEAMTFLRRALNEELGAINEREVGISLRDSFTKTGFALDDELLRQVTLATAGYPYLIQLVGYYVWKRASTHADTSQTVTKTDVEEGVAIAHDRFHQAVHEPALANISKGCMNYLIALAQEGEGASTAAIARRMNKSPKSTSSYRKTLLQRQVIEAPRRGYVKLAIPFMREYILDNEQELLERYA